MKAWSTLVVSLWLCGCGEDPAPGGDGETESGSGSTTGDPATATAPSTSSASMSSTSTSSATDDTGETSDTGSTSSGSDASGTTGEPACTRAPVQPRHIWISNASESTISKISTEDLVEEARYVTRDDADGNPSRTSVNFNGDVAVANRSSGITVFAGDIADCPDPVGTSSGPDNVLPYPDGCLLWHTPFRYASQRPVAWTQGEWSDETCRYENTLLWTSGANATIDVILLDGETGEVVQTVPIPGVTANFYGIYGAAVDSEGNFWGSMLGVGSIVNVALADFEVTTYAMPVTGYGMTVDPNGMVWTCSTQAARLDPGTGQWDVFNPGGSGGCNVDGNGILWMANNPLVGLDIVTGVVQHTFDMPAYVHGVAVDFDGYVWGAAIYNDEVYRIDPSDGAVDTVTGLNFPYTYSDMTGFGLQNVSM